MKNIIDNNLKEILNIVEENKEKGIDVYTILGRLQISTMDINSVLLELKKMINLGFIIEKKKHHYVATKFTNKLIGSVKISKKGFAIVKCNNTEKLEIFIAPKYAKRLLDEDIVEVELIENDIEGRRPEGLIKNIISRGKTKYVGRVSYDKNNKYCFVTCNNNKIKNDIYIPIQENNYIEDGDIVLCNINRWLEEDKNPIGNILEILGKENQPRLDILSIVKEYGLEVDFSNAINKEVKKIIEREDKKDIDFRVDLRNELIFTIDGEDAKDLDDAISIKYMDNGNFKLSVHIADVSHYVKENMKIDKEALKRGTSVYLIDKVIPMLPKEISNGVCSLNPNEDRLTLTIDMEINNSGDVVSYNIFESIINSKSRMTYNKVSDILENKDIIEINDRDLLTESLINSEKLANILKKKREDRGNIDFEIEKSKILLDELGVPIDIKKEERRIANNIIEEFMIVANETIATHFNKLNIPFIYRNHDKPNEDDLNRIEDILNKYGYDEFNINKDINSKDFQLVLNKIKNTEIEDYINKVMLRSLKEARYDSLSKGHFGLATDNYCHFTSPIRRYPDLQIHRIIKLYINDNLNEQKIKKYTNRVKEVSEISSKLERYAQDIEEEVSTLKKIEFMSDKINKIYSGKVSNINNKGMFVRLENTIEGLVRMDSILNDKYFYDCDRNCIIDLNDNVRYSIGSLVNVKVIKCDIINKEIDFEIEI